MGAFKELVTADCEAVEMLRKTSLAVKEAAKQLHDARLMLIATNGALVGAVDHIKTCLELDAKLLGELADIQADAEPALDRAMGDE